MTPGWDVNCSFYLEPNRLVYGKDQTQRVVNEFLHLHGVWLEFVTRYLSRVAM